MLQKVLVVLVGLVMSLVGALSPAGLFGAQPLGDLAPATAPGAVDERFATVRLSDGLGFARVSVLWVEVDGRRVTDDAWGTGLVQEMRFKVGVKDVDGLALAVGDRLVPLRPTDVITVRMFHGEFSYRDIGLPKASIQLQGTVKTTLHAGGDATNRVVTEIVGAPDAPVRPADGRVAFVVLDTGARVDTVAVEDGGARLYTEEAAEPAAATATPGNLLAKWVKIDGRLVQEYTWGDAPVGRIEFEPADAGRGGVVVAFNGAPSVASAGSRVVVRDFVGEHVVYQVAGGLVRLRLDGYAASFDVGPATADGVQLGEGAPIASFEYSPANPKTTDTIRFKDTSQDDTLVVLRVWRFDDDATSVLPTPSHRFTTPGMYTVTLNVTDTDRQSSETSVVITVRNAEPVPDFDFWPKIVTTDTLVTFTDDSHDTDGDIVARHWDFGDGTTSTEAHPTHRFERGGAATVTLTVTDELGAKAKLSKVVDVRNTPPQAAFNYSPTEIMSLVPVTFQDDSTDRDGTVVQWAWDFGDGTKGSGRSPVHAFPRPGPYTISLTATDNAGASDTTTQQVFVENRVPVPHFVWTPDGAPATEPVRFTSLSDDPDGRIVLHRWDFGDGGSSLDATTTHSFPRAGIYNVTLTVTDNLGASASRTVAVGIENAIPRAIIHVLPNPASRGAEVTFADASTDPDGDAIVNRTWSFGPDEPLRYTSLVQRAYARTGEYRVELTVVDAAGKVGYGAATLSVVNRVPVLLSTGVSTSAAVVGANVTFTAAAADADAQPGDPPVRILWSFSDGTTAEGGSVNRTFAEPGRYSANVWAVDFEGGSSNARLLVVDVEHPPPLAAFTWSPLVPLVDTETTFTQTADSPNGHIVSYQWSFGDGSTGVGPVIKHTFTEAKTHLVRLRVTDNVSKSAEVEVPVRVNALPLADFSVSPLGIVPLGEPVTFTDLSTDPHDGGRIESRVWSFGEDGATSTARSPTHRYRTPGPHEVTLTVTDSDGSTASVSKTVRVDNRPPVARWSASTPRYVGEPIAFTSLSYDPDHTPIRAWSWAFGDGATSSADNLTHTYQESGRYTVSLTVSDGELQSRLDAGSVAAILVGADHATPVDIRAILPSGLPADLQDPAYRVTLTKAGVTPGHTAPKSQLLPNGTALAYGYARGDWARGDVLAVEIEAPTLFDGVLRETWTLDDRDGRTRTPLLEFEIPLPLVPTLDVRAGTVNTFMDVPILVPNKQETSERDPVYRSMNEPFRGSGNVTFPDGSPAPRASVVLEARWLPIRAVGALRDGGGLESSDLVGWCRAATVFTDSLGRYDWVIDTRSDCAVHDAGVNPVGRWEIRARASLSLATSATSETRTIYVDPTGGLLWTAAAPP